jgi:hypothetical protein
VVLIPIYGFEIPSSIVRLDLVLHIKHIRLIYGFVFLAIANSSDLPGSYIHI